MKRAYSMIAVLILIPAALFFCLYLFNAGDADWLTVEAPSFVYRNQPFKIKIILTNPEPGNFIGADLHWMDKHKVSHGFLSWSRPVKITADQKIYEMTLNVPASEDVSYIFPVISISGDGTWNNRIKAADTEPIPVFAYPLNNKYPEIISIKDNDIMSEKIASVPESVPLRFITAWVLFAAGATCYRKRHLLHLKWISAVVLFSAAWEALNASTITGSILRKYAINTGTYISRREPQQIITIIIVVVITATVLFLIMKLAEKEKIILWTAVSVFWSISLLRLLSLHEIDTLLSMTAAGVQAGQIIRVTAAVIIFITAVMIGRNAVHKT